MGENIPNLKAKSFCLLLHLQNVKHLLLKYRRQEAPRLDSYACTDQSR